MAQIGSFGASASNVFNLDFLPEKFLVVGTGASQALSNFSVVTNGIQLMSITSLARINALARFDSGTILDSAAPTNQQAAAYLRLATGRINKGTTITGTNSVAAVRNVFAASTCISDVARRAVEQSINPSANATFDSFECLVFDPSNLLRAQVTFANGYTDEYTPTELQALYANYHVAEADGNVNGLTIIDADSGAGLISQVTLFAGSGSAIVVLKTDYVQL